MIYAIAKFLKSIDSYLNELDEYFCIHTTVAKRFKNLTKKKIGIK